MRNLLEYLNRARNDAEKYSGKEITRVIEEEYMNVLDKIREEGKLEGELKGKMEKAIETARKMRTKGFSVSQIEEITGLSEKELKENGLF